MTERQNGSRRDLVFLFSTVGASFFTRALLIWLFRPEFSGWFNHTHYYFVQVRGLLEQGSLPYSDLPLLFYVYASVARLMMLGGVPLEYAVVSSTRFMMSIVPALTAVPVFIMLRTLKGRSEMTLADKLLVVSAAFLPLNLVYMPELLQKNALGLLLLSTLLVAVQRTLSELSIQGLLPAAGIVVMIAASHFGTLVVTFLFALSLAVSLLMTEGFSRRTAAVVTAGLGAVLLGVVSLAVGSPGRLDRISEYARTNLSNSLVGKMFTDGDLFEKGLYLGAIVVPLMLLLLAVRFVRQQTGRSDQIQKAFVLANVLFAYLLAAPFFDTALIPRFLLFLPIPLLVILSMTGFGHGNRFVRILPASAMLALCLVMALGEATSVIMRNDANREAQSELHELRGSAIVSPEDLVVTSYGVNTVCNWFLGTKSSLITSVEESDFQRHPRVFALVTETAAFDDLPADRDSDDRLSDVEKYYASRRAIVPPKNARSVFRGSNFELFEISSVPEDWEFNREGSWIGYK